MPCCSEANCKRRHPIGIYLGAFSGQVFAATRMRLVSDHGNGTATFAASEKHDVTPQLRQFIRDNPEYVLNILESRLDDGEDDDG